MAQWTAKSKTCPTCRRPVPRVQETAPWEEPCPELPTRDMIAVLMAELKMVALHYTKFTHILRIKVYRHHAVGRLPVYYGRGDVPVFWIQATHDALSALMNPAPPRMRTF